MSLSKYLRTWLYLTCLVAFMLCHEWWHRFIYFLSGRTLELSTVSNWNKHLRRDSEILCLFYFRKTESNSVMLRSSCEYIRPSSVLALLPMTHRIVCSALFLASMGTSIICTVFVCSFNKGLPQFKRKSISTRKASFQYCQITMNKPPGRQMEQ